MKELLKIENLSAAYAASKQDVLKNVSLSLQQGKIVGLVGESGCGKTTLLKAILGPKLHRLSVTEGSILFENQDLLKISEADRRKILGNEIGMIVQDSISSLNPIKKIKVQIQELLQEKQGLGKEEAYRRGEELLVSLSCPKDVMQKYPFQLSGGQRQRVIIAMSFLLAPKLLLADEPTTALDVTVQAQILKEMLVLKKKYGTAILLISHNLGVVSRAADEIGVMYKGELVEYGAVEDILKYPAHPYTKALIRCIPDLGHNRNTRLYRIPDERRDVKVSENACCFAGRCEKCRPVCLESHPPEIKRKKGFVVCHLLNSPT